MELTAKPPLIPSTRFVLAILCFFGCFVVYSLRTNMSFAIVCMAKENKTTEVIEEGAVNKCGKEIVARDTSNDIEGEFEWSKTTQGHILGAFFWGYLGSQVLGGYLASRFGGKRVILATILGASLLTLASPMAARTHAYVLAGLRVAIGFLQGATFPAMHTMWSVWGPPLELSVLTGVSYAGAQIGNVFVLPLSGFLCQYGFDGGWPSIFYTLGIIGVIWSALWTYIVTDRPSNHPLISEAEKEYIIKAVEASTGKQTDKPPATPWGSILTSRAVWACWFGHFAGDWGAYTMLVSLPSFLKDVLGLDLSSLGMVSAVPYIAYFVVINIGGFLADFIRSKNILGTLNTRRAAMLLALLGQGMFLVLSGYCGCGQEALVIIYLTAGMAISGLQYSGFVVNYLDIAPSFSGTIMGMGNTISCLAGIVSPIVTSALTPNGTQEEWQGVLWLTAGILAIGSIVFSLFASGEVQEWAKLKGGEAPEELPLKEAEANLEKDTH
uniref:Sialin n=1 Tax=Haemonchus contortus TaxID=6289 RepID=A0A7I4YF61_HAECO